MGFFGFGKKKSDSTASLPSAPQSSPGSMQLPNIDSNLSGDGLELDQSLDLPPITDDSQIPQSNKGFNNLQSQVSNQNISKGTQDSMQDSMYIPALDSEDSLPGVDDSEIIPPTVPMSKDGSQTVQGMPDLNLQLDQSIMQSQSQDLSQGVSFSPVNPPDGMGGDYRDDINRLFISDDWKEPDWNNYDPYTEEKIDEPSPQDFGMATSQSRSQSTNAQNQFSLDSQVMNLQSGNDSQNSFQNNSLNDSNQSNELDTNDLPVIEPTPAIRDRPKALNPIKRPVELYVRGKAYAKVFSELDQINTTLSKVDSKLPNCEDIWKRQDPLLNTARDQMEFLYKKLSSIDKKVFTN